MTERFPHQTGALVVTPTRELATQIAGVFAPFLSPSLSLALLIGGQELQTDISTINQTGWVGGKAEVHILMIQ